MKLEKANTIPLDNLREIIAGSQLSTSRLELNFDLAAMFEQVTVCRIIKENLRRQVYYLETPRTGYFFKVSTLVRSKDRWRHLLLPHRKWSEWRNLHRLNELGIAAAKPKIKGQNKTSDPVCFFILTEEVAGTSPDIKTAEDAVKLGRFVARLHDRGVYHSDLHPANIIMASDGQPWLIDVQQVVILPWLPLHLRVHNLGNFVLNIRAFAAGDWLTGNLIDGYNSAADTSLTRARLERAADYQQQQKYRSRSKRCCRNSSQFTVVSNHGLKGYQRKSFSWSRRDLQLALEEGEPLKDSHVLAYQGTCLKKQPRRAFHKNRCLISWKMSRALDVRGIPVPTALGYFAVGNINCFVSELIDNGIPLNEHLSSISEERLKRRALKKLALWLQKFYDTRVWQRDFKSDNILYSNGKYFMVDLDGVKIRRVNEKQKIANLAQLNASLSNAVSLRDRLRFYHYLTAGQNPSRQQRREVYRRVWDISRKKTTHYYNLDLDQLWKPGRSA